MDNNEKSPILKLGVIFEMSCKNSDYFNPEENQC
jgi:hypothetical protein